MTCRLGVVVLAVAVATVIGCGAPPVSEDGGVEASGGGWLAAGGGSGGGEGGGEASGGGTAGGYEVDAGVDAGLDDGGVEDAGTDAGEDGGTPERDAGVWDAGVDPDGCPPASGVGAPFRLRAMAANLTSGNNQSWTPGPGKRILQGLGPDVVLVQEFNYGSNSEADVQGFVAEVCGSTCEYARGASGSIRNGVISRWPIIASGDWDDPEVGDREFTWAHIDLPGPRDLWVVSLHLLTSSAGKRNSEAQALITKLAANVPADDFLLLGGDFNTGTRSEACVSTLGQRVVTAGPHPEDNEGNESTNANRNKPYDWVLASRCLQKSQVPVAIGTQAFTGGLVFDSRVYTPLADVTPVLASDSSAPQMQHMGVVKDFLIQP